MLKIGEFSKLSRISVRMLRHYDEIGLLTPGEIDPYSGYRYYSESQLPAAGRIAALRDMGFGLADIGKMLQCHNDRPELERAMVLQLKELRTLQAETARRIRMLESAIRHLREDDIAMQYNVSIKTLPERYVASVRMTLPSYDSEAALWSVLVEETASLHLVPDDPCYCSVVYHDSEYREREVDVEAQKTVRGRYPDTEHVRFKTLQPVTFASTTYKGSYALMDEANATVATWVRDNGYAFDGPAFFIYHVSPHETSNPEEFVTEICYPIREA